MGTSTHCGRVSGMMISTGRRWVVGGSPNDGSGRSFRLSCHAHAENKGAARNSATRTGFRVCRIALMRRISQIFQNNQVFRNNFLKPDSDWCSGLRELSFSGMSGGHSAGDTESRGRQILVGAAILLVVTACFVSLLMFWRLIPGWVGESVGKLVGLMSTPFLMEASFAMLGLLIVISLNIWRRRREGDEFVTMEENNDGEGGSAR